MRNLRAELARRGADTTVDLVRTVVREEIARVLSALALAARELDSYDTAEIESRSATVTAQVAEGTLANLLKCWTGDHGFEDWRGFIAATCRSCGAARPNPFETKEENDA